MKKNKLKKILTNVWNYIFEVYIMFLVFGTSGVIFSFSYLVPKYGVEILIAAIAFVSFTRIYNKRRRRQ